MAENKSNMFRYVLVAGMLIFGSINTLAKRAQNLSYADGNRHERHAFKKPWTQTLIMFAGEMMCLLYFKWQQRQERLAKQAENKVPLLVNEERSESNVSVIVHATEGEAAGQVPEAEQVEEQTPKTSPWIFLAPTVCDLLGTTLAGVGLLYTKASVWQMLRGSIIIFSGILSVIFLKRKFYAYNWLGMGVVTSGLAVVGTAALLSDSGDDETSTSEMLMGYGMILLGQMCSAVQMVVEETFLKNKKLPAVQVVGMEGTFGLVLMIVLVLPITYAIPGNDGGSYEDAVDGAVMIGQNGALLAYVLLYWLSIAFYNFCGLSVAKYLSTIHRTLVDALRTVLVWVVGIFIYYALGSDDMGEKWTSYSYMQLGGFGLLMLGTMIYNKVLVLPGLYYPPPVDTTAK